MIQYHLYLLNSQIFAQSPTEYSDMVDMIIVGLGYIALLGIDIQQRGLLYRNRGIQDRLTLNKLVRAKCMRCPTRQNEVSTIFFFLRRIFFSQNGLCHSFEMVHSVRSQKNKI